MTNKLYVITLLSPLLLLSLADAVPVSELAGINQLDEGLPMPGAAPADDALCKGHPDGSMVPDPSSKCDFYECNNGKAFKFHCPGGLIFDPVKNCCNYDPNGSTQRPPYHGNSTFNCSGKADGFYPDEKDPTKFHECVGGYAYDFVCPPGTVFDLQRKACAHKAQEPEAASGDGHARPRRHPDNGLEQRLREKHIDPHQLESTTMENFDIWID